MLVTPHHRLTCYHPVVIFSTREGLILPSFLPSDVQLYFSPNAPYNKSPHHHGWICCYVRHLVDGQTCFFACGITHAPATEHCEVAVLFGKHPCSLQMYHCARSALRTCTLLLAAGGGGSTHRFHSSNTAWWSCNSNCTAQLSVIWAGLKMCLLFRLVHRWSECCPHIINKGTSGSNWTLP